MAIKRILTAALLGIVTLGTAGYLLAGKSEHSIAAVQPVTLATGTEVGMLAPNFTMNDPNGKPLSLQKYRGKVVVLDFWATWCGPCRQVLPHFKELWEKYKSKDVVFIGVSLDKDLSKWKQFIKDEKMSWLHVADGKFWENAVAQQYRVESIPSVWVLDKSGIIQGKGLRGAAIENVIEKSLTK